MRSQSPPMRAFPFISGIVSLVFGLVLAIWLKPSFSLELRIAAFSSLWPTVTGKVLDVRTLFTERRGDAPCAGDVRIRRVRASVHAFASPL